MTPCSAARGHATAPPQLDREALRQIAFEQGQIGARAGADFADAQRPRAVAAQSAQLEARYVSVA